MSRLPENVSAVTVSQPVNGRKNRRPVRKRKAAAPKATHVTVDPRVMAAARRARRHGQRLVIVDAETVRLVNE